MFAGIVVKQCVLYNLENIYQQEIVSPLQWLNSHMQSKLVWYHTLQHNQMETSSLLFHLPLNKLFSSIHIQMNWNLLPHVNGHELFSIWNDCPFHIFADPTKFFFHKSVIKNRLTRNRTWNNCLEGSGYLRLTMSPRREWITLSVGQPSTPVYYLEISSKSRSGCRNSK